MDTKTIVEIGVDVTPKQLKGIEAFLRIRKIQYYIEPKRDIPYPYHSIEELKAVCEGK